MRHDYIFLELERTAHRDSRATFLRDLHSLPTVVRLDLQYIHFDCIASVVMYEHNITL
jgi:hypothetical protein